MREPVFGVADQVRHKPGFTAAKVDKKLEISDLGGRRIVLYIVYVAKTKVLISCTVAAFAKKKDFLMTPLI